MTISQRKLNLLTPINIIIGVLILLFFVSAFYVDALEVRYGYSFDDTLNWISIATVALIIILAYSSSTLRQHYFHKVRYSDIITISVYNFFVFLYYGLGTGSFMLLPSFVFFGLFYGLSYVKKPVLNNFLHVVLYILATVQLFALFVVFAFRNFS